MDISGAGTCCMNSHPPACAARVCGEARSNGRTKHESSGRGATDRGMSG